MIESGAGVTANLLRDVLREQCPDLAELPLSEVLPAGAASRFFTTYARADEATRRRARGLAALKSLFLMLMGQNGDRGLPGGTPAWGPAGAAALHRVSGPAGSRTEPG